MNDTPVALVTGATRGIGLQIAKELAARGLTVLVGARALDRGEAAARAVGHGARAVQLDVRDPASIEAAASWIRREMGRLDVLVNNAGISHAGPEGRSVAATIAAARPSVASIDGMRAVFETNVFGVVAVTQALLPLLREAPAGRIVNVSSSLGSLALAADPDNPYRTNFAVDYAPSKAALNAVTLAMAIELAPTRIKVNAACPGYIATALNNFEGVGSVEDGAREPVRLALLGADGPTGTFSSADGSVPW